MAKLSKNPLVHETAEVKGSSLGRYTEVAERSHIQETTLGDFRTLSAETFVDKYAGELPSVDCMKTVISP